MSMRLHRPAYEKLVQEDIDWLLRQPRTLERDHVLLVLQGSPEREYEDRALADDEVARDALAALLPGWGVPEEVRSLVALKAISFVVDWLNRRSRRVWPPA